MILDSLDSIRFATPWTLHPMDSQTAIQDWGQVLLDNPGLGALSFRDNVLDNPPVPTRAGLYVYLNSMLYDRCSFDDHSVIDFLNARYHQDGASTVSDLVLASFDVLANAMYRNEILRSTNLIRSFLANKLPVFIQANYTDMIFEPATVETCIRNALGRIDPHTFPSLSQLYDPVGRNSVLSEARQDFLFACALHGLIPEKSIEEILGDVPMQSLPASGVLRKDDLVRQFTTNPAKIDQYISELESVSTEGNAGAIAGAIIEILHTLCANNDTMTLKSVCNALSCKTTTLDVLMLFTRPGTLLQPICNLLDNWQDHEDQGEYQPVYDEFGSILLFLVIVQHRFKLQPADMGIETPNSFVIKYFKDSSMSRPIEDLSEHESQLLGAWIKGLFESEAISDELISTCKPKEFYLLVTTLFDQSLKACQANILALETLRGGFDYLLEPFLLPSLVAGFTWFSHCLWEINDDTSNFDVILPVLKALLQPRSMPHDSSDIYKAIIALVTTPLAASLTHAQKQYPSRSDIPRLEASSSDFLHREGTNTLNELASWSTTPRGALAAALRQTIQSLIIWSASSGQSHEGTLPSYTHRQLLDTLQILGAPAVLHLLIDEANDSAHSDTALDIFTIMILTSSQQSSASKRQLTLREALHLEYQNVDDLARTDPARASTLVRLHGRVEALAAPKAGAASEGDGFMTGVQQSGESMQPANIDDVLGEAEHQIALAQNASFGQNALMGLS